MISKEDYLIGYSELILRELKGLNYFREEILEMFKAVNRTKLRKLHIYKIQTDEARSIAIKRGVPIKDALHAVICRDNDYELISRDLHFDLLKDITKVSKPEFYI